MADVTFPYSDPGRAAFEVLDTYRNSNLLAGNHPVLAQPYSYPVAGGTALAQFSVVGLDAGGELVLAITGSVDPDDDIKPIGVLAQSFSEATDGTAPVFYQGAFNMDALVWDASFSTDALKEAAFRGSPSPTQIIVTKKFA